MNSIAVELDNTRVGFNGSLIANSITSATVLPDDGIVSPLTYLPNDLLEDIETGKSVVKIKESDDVPLVPLDPTPPPAHDIEYILV